MQRPIVYIPDDMIADGWIPVGFWRYWLVPMAASLSMLFTHRMYVQAITREWDHHKYEPGAPMVKRRWIKEIRI